MNDLDNWFTIHEGQGIPVVMLHGLSASHHDWDYLAPEIIQAGYQVIIPDLLGHGDSPKPQDVKWYTLDYLYQNFLRWLVKVQIPKPFFLVGHSLGGYLSLKFTIDHIDEIAGLVLAAPFYSIKQIHPLAQQVLQYPSVSEQVIRLARPGLVYSVINLSSAVLGNYPREASKQIAVDYTRTIPACMRFPSTAPDLTPYLHKVQVPVLTIWGKKDLMLKPSSFKKLVKALPQAQSHIFPMCGHEPHLVHFQNFNQLVLEFLHDHSYKIQNDKQQPDFK